MEQGKYDKKTTTRFSNKVENYIKYRPSYPSDMFEFIKLELNLTPEKVVADIGSGTGISTELFLKNGNKVYGIEPNKEMRDAGEKLLSKYSNFISINVTSENTLLDNNSIDLISAFQAFHWFDVPKAKKEFKRILKDGSYVLLVWNDRKTDSTEFLKAYEDLLQEYSSDYKEVNHKNIAENDISLFLDKGYKSKTFENYQLFDFEGIKGRMFSSSYVPDENTQDGQKILLELEKIFAKFNTNNMVKFEYLTEIFYGKVY